MKVCVIGCGWSGIYALKWLRQMDIDAIAFDQNEFFGGLWKYKPNEPGGVFLNTRTTSSKTFMHASDFPFPKNSGHFPTHQCVMEFLDAYIQNFDLSRYIVTGAKVTGFVKEGNEWMVTVSKKGPNDTNIVESRKFNAVVIAQGQHGNLKNTDIPEIEGFTGEVLHSSEYKQPSPAVKDKVVLVVGGGESASDIAAEICTVAKKCHMSIRHGIWFHDRNVGAQQPADVVFTKHQRIFNDYESIPISLGRKYILELMWGKGGSGVAEWQPQCGYLRGFINKSREVVSKIALDYIVPHGKIIKCEGKTVIFEDCNNVTKIDVDMIILATGFAWKPVPYEDQLIWPKHCYKYVFYPKDPSLAIVGTARPVFGSIPGLAELQARWIACVWSKLVALPSPLQMELEIKRDTIRHQKIYTVDHTRLPQLVNHFEYSDELAKKIGCNVQWFRLLLSDPYLFWLALNSPWTAFQYRLFGPHCLREISKQNIKNNWPKNNHIAFHSFNNLILAIDILAVIIVLYGLYIMYYVTVYLPWGFGLL